MRLALIIYGSLDTVSGGYLYDRHLVDILRSKGHQVDIISLPWRSYPQHILQNQEATLQALYHKPDYDLILQDELNHPSLFYFNRRFKQRYPDVPLVSIVHHLRVSERHPPWLMPLYQRVEGAYLRTIDAFIFNSHTTRQAVESFTGTTQHIVGYPAGDRLSITVTPHDVIKRSIEKPFRLLFVGNLIPRKGVHTVLKAVSNLPLDGWHFTIVSGPNSDETYVRYLKKTINEYALKPAITWLNAPSDAQIAEAYKQHHVFVMPSQYEGFGIVYLEAMSAGCVVIGSTAGAASELISHGENGYLVPPDAPHILTDLLGYLKQNRDHLALMGKNALSRYNQHPPWAQTMNNIHAFLLSIGG